MSQLSSSEHDDAFVYLLVEEALSKLLKKIERNIDYFRGEKNPGLNKLLEEYVALAQGDADADSRLQTTLGK